MHIFKILFLSLLFFLFSSSGIIIAYGQKDTVKIGMIVSSMEDSKVAIQGAQMAINKANIKGGYQGSPFELKVRSCEGPWGVGSKETVNLIYEDEVLAILGSLDGRNAHLTEQVAAKSHIVFLSSWATDPTLSRAYVPWYLRGIQDDKKMAEKLVDHIFRVEKLSRVFLLADNTYDAKMSADSFNKAANAGGFEADNYSVFNELNQDLDDFIKSVVESESETIVYFGGTNLSFDLLEKLRKKGSNQKIYSALVYFENASFIDFNSASYDGLVLLSPASWQKDAGKVFREAFKINFGYLPGIKAAYAYDGMNMIIEAIVNSGIDKEKIRDNLRQVKFNGITGSISFDDLGNRQGTIQLFEVNDGKLRLVN